MMHAEAPHEAATMMTTNKQHVVDGLKSAGGLAGVTASCVAIQAKARAMASAPLRCVETRRYFCPFLWSDGRWSGRR